MQTSSMIRRASRERWKPLGLGFGIQADPAGSLPEVEHDVDSGLWKAVPQAREVSFRGRASHEVRTDRHPLEAQNGPEEDRHRLDSLFRVAPDDKE
jgi:hypothetical protein